MSQPLVQKVMVAVDLAVIAAQDLRVAARRKNLDHVHMSAVNAQGKNLVKYISYGKDFK